MHICLEVSLIEIYDNPRLAWLECTLIEQSYCSHLIWMGLTSEEDMPTTELLASPDLWYQYNSTTLLQHFYDFGLLPITIVQFYLQYMGKGSFEKGSSQKFSSFKKRSFFCQKRWFWVSTLKCLKCYKIEGLGVSYCEASFTYCKNLVDLLCKLIAEISSHYGPNKSLEQLVNFLDACCDNQIIEVNIYPFFLFSKTAGFNAFAQPTDSNDGPFHHPKVQIYWLLL